MTSAFQRTFLAALLAISPVAVVAQAKAPLRIWNDTPRFRCPFEQTGDFSAIGFTGKVWSGGKADTFYACDAGGHGPIL